jgi:hypothetical protein
MFGLPLIGDSCGWLKTTGVNEIGQTILIFKVGN